MFDKKQIVLIPFWVQEILRRNKLDLPAALDFKKLRDIMSLQDLAGFLAFQGYLSTIAGLKDASVGSLYFGWLRGIATNERDHLDHLNLMVDPLSNDESIRKDIFARIFTEAARQPNYEEAFISYDLTPQFAGVVVYPGFFGVQGDDSMHLPVVEAMLKALYVYESYNEVCQTPLFKRYLELLARK